MESRRWGFGRILLFERQQHFLPLSSSDNISLSRSLHPSEEYFFLKEKGREKKNRESFAAPPFFPWTYDCHRTDTHSLGPTPPPFFLSADFTHSTIKSPFPPPSPLSVDHKGKNCLSLSASVRRCERGGERPSPPPPPCPYIPMASPHFDRPEFPCFNTFLFYFPAPPKFDVAHAGPVTGRTGEAMELVCEAKGDDHIR